MTNVLVLAAHPDDEVLGPGATIRKFASEGADVRLMTFTDGASARGGGVDRRECVSVAAGMLGISMFRCFSFPDNAMDSVSLLDVIRALEKELDTWRWTPDIILTHSPFCLNIDHRIVQQAALTAFRGCRAKLMCFEVPSSSEWNPVSGFVPNCYVELKPEHVNVKLLALQRAYGDELRDPPHPRSLSYVNDLMNVYGPVVGVELAERFMVLREVL